MRIFVFYNKTWCIRTSTSTLFLKFSPYKHAIPPRRVSQLGGMKTSRPGQAGSFKQAHRFQPSYVIDYNSRLFLSNTNITKVGPRTWAPPGHFLISALENSQSSSTYCSRNRTIRCKTHSFPQTLPLTLSLLCTKNGSLCPFSQTANQTSSFV